MAKVRLQKIAHARSGDKGDNVNIGLIAILPKDYEVIKKLVTADRVKQHFSHICNGEVIRYELPNIGALNFVLKQSLGGGGTTSLRSDGQGKTLAAALLKMEIDI